MNEDCVVVTGGTSMWAVSPSLVISDGNYGGDLFRVDAVDMNLDKSAGGTFRIHSNHPTAVDSDHDSARIFYAEGAGMQFDRMTGPRIGFTGVLLKVHYYDEVPVEDDYRCDRCTKEHGFVDRYIPPQREFKPRLVEIVFMHKYAKGLK